MRPIILALPSLISLNLTAQTLDPGFAPLLESNPDVQQILEQPDGKILVLLKDFTYFDGTGYVQMFRMESNGAFDASFTAVNPGGLLDPGHFDLQSTGKIIVWGYLDGSNGGPSGQILARLNTDGTQDMAFDPQSVGSKVFVQSTDSILVGDDFGYLQRLGPDGALDAGFDANFGAAIGSFSFIVGVQSDDKLVLSDANLFGPSKDFVRINTNGTLDGTFADIGLSTYPGWLEKAIIGKDDGIYFPSGTAPNYPTIKKLDPNGGNTFPAYETNQGSGFKSTVDLFGDGVFTPDNPILLVQSDGSLLFGGDVDSLNAVAVQGLARLLPSGSPDLTFNSNIGAGPDGGDDEYYRPLVENLAVQTDGKIWVGGDYRTFNGSVPNAIVRLNTNGTADISADPGLFVGDEDLGQVRVQSDGKVLVTNYGILGATGTSLARINTDGSFDVTFNGNLGVFDADLYALEIQADGNILVGVDYDTAGLIDGVANRGIARIDNMGNVEAGFPLGSGIGAVNIPGDQPEVYVIKELADGRILVAGNFDDYNGTPVSNIVLLNNDGTVDNTFGSGANEDIYFAEIQADNKILLSGALTSFNGTAVGFVFRLNSDLSLDNAFNTNVAPYVTADEARIALQSDGSIITHNGYNMVQRFNPDGTRDPEFSFHVGYGALDDDIQGLVVQPNDKLIVTGEFSLWNGEPANGLVRLQPIGTRDNTFTPVFEWYRPGQTTEAELYDGVFSGDDMYVIGDFVTADGQQRLNIAKYNIDPMEPVDLEPPIEFANSPMLDPGLFVSIEDWVSVGKVLVDTSTNKALFAMENAINDGGVLKEAMRLNADGTLDPTLNLPNLNLAEFGFQWAMQSTGKVIISGTDDESGDWVFIRLNTDGTLDPSFNSGNESFGSLSQILIQPDDKILISGNFGNYDQTFIDWGFTRLDADGNLDVTFNTNIATAFDFVQSSATLGLQSTGHILVGGFVTTSSFGDKDLARLDMNGNLEATFSGNVPAGVGALAPNYLLQIGTLSTDSVVIGDANGTLRKLSSAGVLDGGFDGNFSLLSNFNTLHTLVIQPNDQILIGGDATSGPAMTRYNSNGTRDVAFEAALGTGPFDPAADGLINSLGLQSDGKIWVGGQYIRFNGSTLNRIVRLNSDGTTEISSPVGPFYSETDVLKVEIQTDGKVILHGDFLAINETLVPYLARVETDGSLDAAFMTNIGTGPEDVVYAIVLQPDGKILLGTEEDVTFDGTPMSGLIRLNTDGTIDGTFLANLGTGFSNGGSTGSVNSIALQSDGKILVGGLFDDFNGTPVSNLVRLNADGTLENSLGGNGPDDVVADIEIQPDGRIWIAGSFDMVNGIDVFDGLLRLNSDLTNDIQVMIDEDIALIKLQDDGKLLVYGLFGSIEANPVNGFGRINTDGTYDGSFQPVDLQDDVYEIELQADGKILLAGDFGYAVRLDADGSLDPTHLFSCGCVFNDVVVGDDAAYWVGDFLTINSTLSPGVLKIEQLVDPTIIESFWTANTSLDGAQLTDALEGQGVSWGDYNGDGELDIYLSNFTDPGPRELFQNNGDGTFTEIATGPAIASIAGRGRLGTWGDYDNDGDLDLFYGTLESTSNQLYRNDGGSFTLATAGDISTDATTTDGATWIDFDNDGDLDLFGVSAVGDTPVLYENNGDGTFSQNNGTAITQDAGLIWTIAWADYDGDGDPDLFLPTDDVVNNLLYENNGDGTFTKITAGIIANDPVKARGASWADYDNDGDFDLFVPTMTTDPYRLYQNDGSGNFTSVTAGDLTSVTDAVRASAWGDYDNDGDLDVYVGQSTVRQYFSNNGDGTFAQGMFSELETPPGFSTGAAAADYDRDGDLDLMVAVVDFDQPNIFLQNNGNANNWINILLEGTFSNRTAVGSVVRAKAGGIWQTRQVQTMTGMGGQNSLNVEFGFGGSGTIDSLAIEWPSGIREYFTGQGTNAFLTITEPVSGSLQTDSLNLIRFYEAAGGPSWANNTNWLASPVSSWYGVTVSGGRVTSLDLPGNDLTGSISGQIGNLDTLRNLDLSGNSLTGSLPAQIGQLTHLRYLDLSGNSLSGGIPATTTDLTNLDTLDLSSNQFTGSLPTNLGNLVGAEMMRFNNNLLSGTINPSIGSAISLRTLDLSNNSLTGTLPDLSGLTVLDTLRIQNNSITGISDLTLLPQLDTAQIAGNGLDFGDIEPNLAAPISYIPQDSIPVVSPVELSFGSDSLLAVSVAGSDNVYQWQFNQVDSTGLDNDTIQIANFSPQHIGKYRLRATSNVVTDLTLWSKTIQVRQLVTSGPAAQPPPTVAPNSFIATWDPVGGATGYLVDVSDTISFSTFVPGYQDSLVTDTSLLVTGLMAEIEYFYRVRSIVGADTSAYSNIVTVMTPANLNVIASDSLALVAFYNSTGGPNWTDNTNWLAGTIDTWFGIGVQGTRINTVDLASNNLVGPLPDSIALLDGIFRLNLSFNQLTGTLPDSIGNWTSADEVSIYTNQLTGPIPATYGNLTNVTWLSLGSNQLSGPIPAELGNLSNLRVLWLGDNQLTGGLPAELGNLNNLEILGIYSNPSLGGPIPAELGNLSNLEQLWLYNDSLSGTIPAELGNLVNLDSMGLFLNRLSGMIPTELGNLASLKYLSLYGNDLTGPIPGSIGSLDSLGTLSLRDNGLNGPVPVGLANLTDLTGIRLERNQLDGLPLLTALVNLDTFSIGNNRLDFGDIEPNISLTGFSYVPQDSVGVLTDTLHEEGEDITFLTPVGGASNTYQWSRNGSPISGAAGSSYTIPGASFSDEGVYQVVVNNSVVTDLTLYGRPWNLKVSSLERDSLALVDLFNSLAGAEWFNSDNWLTGPISTWFGVVLGNNRVIGVNLPGNNLVGPVPNSLQEMLALEVLDLSNNKITKLPKMTVIQALQTLNVARNKLDFSSLEQNSDAASRDFADQDMLGNSLDTAIDVGTGIRVEIETSGPGNVYQWFKDGVPVPGADTTFLDIDDINFGKMGIYTLQVTNPAVPDVILFSFNQRVQAQADVSGTVLAPGGGNQPEAVAFLLEFTDFAGYDTVSTVAVTDGAMNFDDVILGDYAVAARAEINGATDTLLLPGYFRDGYFWEDADSLILRTDTSGIDIQMTAVPDTAALDGEGLTFGFLETDDLDTTVVAGRLDARRKISKAGVALARVRLSMRLQADTFELFAYTYTDTLGNYKFEEVPNGVFRIRFEVPGYPMDTTTDVFFTMDTENNMGVIESNAFANPETGKIEVETTVIVGLNERGRELLNMYPNPARDKIFVEIKRFHGLDFELQITDLSGKVLLRAGPSDVSAIRNGIELDLRSMPDGIFLITLFERAQEIRVGKLLIQR